MESSHSGDLRPASIAAGFSDLEGPYGDPRNTNSMPIGLTADDLQCPICVDTIHDAFVTTCGHTFCYQCITTHLKHRRNCPSCGNYLTTDHIYPNFLLSKVLVRAAATQAAETSSSLADLVQQALVGTDKKLHITDLDEVIGLLKGKRDQLARHEATSSLQLLLLFLKEAKLHKERELSVLGSQLRVLDRDLDSVTHKTQQGGGYARAPQQQQQQQQQQLPLGAGAAAPPQRHRRVQICTGAIPPSDAGVGQPGGHSRQKPQAVVKQEREDVTGEAAAAAIAPVQAQAPTTAPSVRVKVEECGQGDEQPMPPAAPDALAAGPGGSQADPLLAQSHTQSLHPLVLPSNPTPPQPGPMPPSAQPAEAGGPSRAAGAAATAAQVPEIPAPRTSPSGLSLPIPSSALQIADLARELHGMGQEQCVGGVRKLGGVDRQESPPPTATPPEELSALRAAKKRRIITQFEQLQSCYLQLRAPGSTGEGQRPLDGLERQEQLTTMLRQLSPPAHSLPLPPLLPLCPLPPPHQQQQQPQQQQEAQPSCPSTCPTPYASSSTLTPEPTSSQEQVVALPGAAAAAAAATPGDQGDEGQQQPLKHPRLAQLGSTAGCSEPCREEGAAKPGLAASHRNNSSNDLQQFSQMLSTITQHSRMSVQAEVPYAACGGWLRSSSASTVGVASYPQPSTAILDMEFDMEEELLATCAGQRVFLWDYEDVLSTTPDSLEPVCELCCRSKLATISCSRHERALLAAGDAEGRVYLWDVSTRQVVHCHAAHEKRVWALDFSPNCGDQQPGSCSGGSHLLASGSDDHMLKVWSPKEQRQVAAVDTGANVCSVRFNPWREHLIAAGSAAHTAMVFDLRMMRGGGNGVGTGGAAAPTTVPLASFGGHQKAVAYVRWAGEDEVLSASTDSMLRLWSLHGASHRGCAEAATADAATHLPAASAAETGKHANIGRMGSSGAWADEHGGEAVRTYSGHTNERNFVGLSQAGNYIATGSETGEVFIYLKHINTPSIRHRLISSCPPANIHHAFHLHHRQRAQQQLPPFISAVSWRQRSQTLMAANSQGHLWALALQP